MREAAGERFAQIELNVAVSDVVVTDNGEAAADEIAARYGVTRGEVLASPQVLIGSPDEIVETLQERRETYGFSYIVVTEPNLEKMAPVVARLAGT